MARRYKARPDVALENDTQTGAGATRKRMIEAAVQAICEQGYYKASSNEIARRAGFDWSSIRHNFGSRERLLLAVVEEFDSESLKLMTSAELEGKTIEERLGSLVSLGFDLWGHREYVAILQIIWNHSLEPETAATTIRSLDNFRRHATKRMRELFRELSPAAPVPDDVMAFIIGAIWSCAVGQGSKSYAAGRPPTQAELRSFHSERSLLVKALSSLL